MILELTDKSFSFTKRSCENDSSPLKIPQTENDSIDASDSIMDNVSEIIIKYKFEEILYRIYEYLQLSSIPK